MSRLLFAESARFVRWVKKNKLRGDVDKLYAELALRPETGVVIPGTGGLRKVRMAGQGRGKSGGFRVVYVLVVNHSVALVVDGYSKSVKEDLTADELAKLANIVAGMLPDAARMIEAAKTQLREWPRGKKEQEGKL